MKSEDTELRPFSGRFVKCPIEILTRTDISPAALKAWLLLKMHYDNGRRSPAVGEVCEHLIQDERTVRRHIDKLESEKFLTKEFRKGLPSLFHIPEIPTRIAPRASMSEPSEDPGHRRPHSPDTDDRRPRTSMSDKERILDKEEEYVQPSADSSPSVSQERDSKTRKPRKSAKRQKSVPPKDPSEIRQILAALDLAPSRKLASVKAVDFDETWEDFQETCLNGTAQDPAPNPYDYVDFGRGLRNWIKKRTGQHRPLNNPPNTPVPAAHRRLD